MSVLEGKTVIVTGSSRGIGARTAQNLAEQGANVVINYRQKAPRAQKIVDAITAAGGSAIAVMADLTEEGAAQRLVDAAVDAFGGLDAAVLNASGGMEPGMKEDYALKLNRDAQVDMLKASAAVMPAAGRIVFVTSHQAHFIETTPTMPEYETVARSKNAGEKALRALIPDLEKKGISLVVVSGDMIDGTITATLLERARPGVMETRREATGKLYTVEEFADEVTKMVTAEVESGHTELVGGAADFIPCSERITACSKGTGRPS